MKTFHTFKTIDGFQKFLRSDRYKHEQSGTLDYVTVGGLVYTMHEYDMDGRSITWANKKHNKMIELETSNRYKNGYSDSIVTEYEPVGLRNDIVYAE